VNQFIDQLFGMLLSLKVKERSERIILSIAISSYFLHLILILFTHLNIIEIESKFFKNPIAAIYTPFSFILVYEVYLLVFFLPKSISVYIAKQYEIITLIVIRRIFKDIANLELSSNWFQIKDDLQFTYDVLTSLILFFLIYLFYDRIIIKKNVKVEKSKIDDQNIQTFVYLKKAIATLLVPILLILAISSLFIWVSTSIRDYQNGIVAFKNINNVFFEEFFTILIIIDVLLLLASFFYSDKFHKIIRNSGFVISTILIKVSFSVDGIVNNALIVGAVLFGFLMLVIHNKFEH
jgi:hypothetical protein